LDKDFINTAMALDPEWKMVFYLYFFLGVHLFMQHTALAYLMIWLPALFVVRDYVYSM
jgi:hypothetical protein